MGAEQMNNMYEDDSRVMELYKMKSDLILFVSKMKSEGFLASVDYDEIPELESEKSKLVIS